MKEVLKKALPSSLSTDGLLSPSLGNINSPTSPQEQSTVSLLPTCAAMAGDSSAPTTKEAYSMAFLVSELVEFAEKLGIKKAIWVCHDW